MRFSALRRVALPVLLLPALGACNDEPVDPFRNWDATEDTIRLYTTDRTEYQGQPAAYDVIDQRTYRVEDANAAGAWDVALTGGGDEPLALTPLGAYFDIDNRAGVNVERDEEFEPLDRAPSADDAYITDESVVLEDDVVYILRSRLVGSGCVRFAKLEPLEIDQEAGTFQFRVIANPRCNDTDLVPPEDD